MQFNAKPISIDSLDTELAIVAIRPEQELSSTVQALDAASNGIITNLIASKDFEAKAANTLLVPAVNGPAKRLLLVGCGESDSIQNLTKVLHAAATAALNTKATSAVMLLDELLGDEYISERAEQSRPGSQWATGR